MSAKYLTFLGAKQLDAGGCEGIARERQVLLGSLRKENLNSHVCVFHALGLLRALQERHIEHVSSRLRPPQGPLCIRVPANGKGVLPPAEYGVPRPRIKHDLALAGPYVGGRHVADGVGVVDVRAAYAQWEPQALEGVRGGVHELRLLPFDPAKLVREIRTAVAQVIALLERDVAPPVADLDVALESGDVQDGLGELEADRDRGAGSGGLLVEGPVDELVALRLGVLVELSIFGYSAGRELDLGLLLGRRVGGLAVGGEIVGKVLLAVLVYRGGEGGIGLGRVEADTNGLLSTGG